ncbi:MAG: hypothetical protein OHK0015_12510 [Chloroflexi bacterium OHK40]
MWQALHLKRAMLKVPEATASEVVSPAPNHLAAEVNCRNRETVGNKPDTGGWAATSALRSVL